MSMLTLRALRQTSAWTIAKTARLHPARAQRRAQRAIGGWPTVFAPANGSPATSTKAITTAGFRRVGENPVQRLLIDPATKEDGAIDCSTPDFVDDQDATTLGVGTQVSAT
jgi:hypothetical protein